MLAPVPTEVPPHDPLYHFHEAAAPRLPPASDSVDAPAGQTAAGVADALVAAVDCALAAVPQAPPRQVTQAVLQPGVWVLSAALG